MQLLVSTEHKRLLLLLVACVTTRLATTIYYVEDPDSLRFALSVADTYSVVDLQPHFPGYPVFWFVAKAFYLLTGRFALAFSVVGGLSTFAIAYYLLRIRRVELSSIEGGMLAGLVFFSPLMWLMSNRYMPDLMGLAVTAAAFYYLSASLAPRSESRPDCTAAVGMALTGMLAGLRLSYLPFLLPPVLTVLWQRSRWRPLGWGLAGTLVWLIPLVLDTGWTALLQAAQKQTAGHFTEFGGTIETNPRLLRRLTGFLQGMWADGLGAYWPGRHPLTLTVAVGSLVLLAAGIRSLRRGTRPRSSWLLLGAGWLTYALWILFYQNVIYKARHVLPLLLPLLLILAVGAASLLRYRSWLSRTAVGLSLAGYAAVTLVLVAQHRSPSAIAQAKSFVDRCEEEHRDLYVASIPLVNEYLASQKVDAHFLSVDDAKDRERLRRLKGDTPVLIVGTYPELLSKPPDRVRTFYHNPYVNRMWPEVEVYAYEPTR